MALYTSAQGKSVDMSALVKKNEHVRAVGNIPVNARGDTIDVHGRIIEPVTAKISKKYNKTVANPSAQVTEPEELSAEERQLEADDAETDKNE